MNNNSSKSDVDSIHSIHQYWFGDINDGLAEAGKNKLWYQATPAQDQAMADRYGELVTLANSGALDYWAAEGRGRLVLILLLDQFSRNIYRGSAEAFHCDAKALSLCLQGIELGQDQPLSLIEKLFFYHPLEHSEELAHQETCVGLMRALEPHYGGAAQAYLQRALGFAEEHRDIIKQFGRFPHRNSVLGRESTAAEVEYLQRGGKTFGQG